MLGLIHYLAAEFLVGDFKNQWVHTGLEPVYTFIETVTVI